MESLPYRVMEASAPLFMDAYAIETGRWVFGSFWGHETVLQEFFARLTLGNHEQGLRAFTLEAPDGSHVRIASGQVDTLKKITSKTPSTTILGALCNVWIFDPALQKPNRAAGEAYVLGCNGEKEFDFSNRIWNAIQGLSQLPILEDWKNYLLGVFHEREWITPLDGVGVCGYRVTIPAEEFEELISIALRIGHIGMQHEVKEDRYLPSDEMRISRSLI